MVTETQVRASETTRLLGVVREVCLAVFIGVVADNLYRVLVGTYSTVSTQAVELGFEHAFATQSDFLFLRQRSEGYIINDTDGEVVFRHRQCQVLIYGQNLSRSRILRTQTVASAYDNGGILLTVEALFYVQVKRFADGTRFLRTVEYGNAFCSLGNGSQEVFG